MFYIQFLFGQKSTLCMFIFIFIFNSYLDGSLQFAVTANTECSVTFVWMDKKKIIYTQAVCTHSGCLFVCWQ